MTYVEGFIVAVPLENKEAYRRHAAEAAPLFQEFGATRMVEAWGDDVPDGKVTDFRRAVQAEDGLVCSTLKHEQLALDARDELEELVR